MMLLNVICRNIALQFKKSKKKGAFAKPYVCFNKENKMQ